MITRQSNGTRRVVKSQERGVDDFVAVFDSYGVSLRPRRSRSLDAEIYATWDQVYRWSLIARTPPITKRKRRRKTQKRRKR